MFWLRHPPYLRWAIAGLVLALGLYVDTRSPSTIDYPYATVDIGVGQAVGPSIELHPVPTGLLPDWDGDISGFAAVPIPAGTPLLPGVVRSIHIPMDWWSVAIPVPQLVVPGTAVRVALEGTIVEGVVAGESIDNSYEFVAAVAFPAAAAAQVAEAAASGPLVMIVGQPASSPGSSG